MPCNIYFFFKKSHNSDYIHGICDISSAFIDKTNDALADAGCPNVLIDDIKISLNGDKRNIIDQLRKLTARQLYEFTVLYSAIRRL